MFSPLHPADRRQTTSLAVSLASHLLFLAWLVHSPAAIFIAPSSVTQGESGHNAISIYFGGATGVTQEHVNPRLTWQHSRKSKKNQLASPDAKAQAGNELNAALTHNDAPAGSAYGSLSYGTFNGPEVRPALPIFSPDPALPADMARSLTGDVVIEVTIDEQGAIVQTVLLQGVDAFIDQRVLVTVQQWRFRPATKDGVAIASKHDIHYHFPR